MVTEAQITAAVEAMKLRGLEIVLPWIDPDELQRQRTEARDGLRAALEAAEKAAWQPASGDAPPLGQRVLLAQPGHEPRIGWLTEHGWDFGCSRCGTWVTHWRPLAASPTESA